MREGTRSVLALNTQSLCKVFAIADRANSSNDSGTAVKHQTGVLSSFG